MLKISEALAKGVSLMNSALKYVCVGLLLFMMALGTVDVIGRYLFNNPILGTLEVFEILLPAIVLLGLGYTQESKGHVSMDLLVTQLSPRTKTILEIVMNGCALVISALILWRGWILTAVYWRMGRTIPTIDVPMFLPQLFVPLGALMLSLVLMVQMLENIIQLRKGN
jgi:TRAP-type C4-dicarboxylate transport system permease small subunit